MNCLPSVRWLRAFMQPVTYLGVMMLVCIYATLTYLIVEDRRTAEVAAIAQSKNLATLFEQLIFRSFKGVDNNIKLVRQFYLLNRSNINLSALLRDSDNQNDLTFQYTIVGPAGFVKASTIGGPDIGFYVGDRRPFVAHSNSKDDQLYISEPIILHASRRRGLVLTRRLSGDDGSFQGVIAATIDIAQFEKLYRQINLGDSGFASLWGTDGVIRVAGANGKLRSDIIGKKYPNAGMFEYLKTSPKKTYWNEPNADVDLERFDHVKRLVSYRKVDGFPLITSVGNSKFEIFKNSRRNASIYWGITLVLTVGIFIAMGFGARREWKLNSTTSALAMTGASSRRRSTTCRMAYPWSTLN